MGQVVDAGVARGDEQVEQQHQQQALERDRAADPAAPEEVGDQRPEQAEDRPRGTNPQGGLAEGEAGPGPDQAGADVQGDEAQPAEQALQGRPERPQGPAVERPVEQPAVQHHHRQQAPPLPGLGDGGGVERPQPAQGPGRGVEQPEGAAAECRRREQHQGVDAEQGPGGQRPLGARQAAGPHCGPGVVRAQLAHRRRGGALAADRPVTARAAQPGLPVRVPVAVGRGGGPGQPLRPVGRPLGVGQRSAPWSRSSSMPPPPWLGRDGPARGRLSGPGTRGWRAA